MKWCRFQKGEKIAYGVIQGETVVEVVGSPFDANGANDKAGVEQKRVAQHQLSDVKLLAPVIPPTFYAAGINYPEHVTWAAQMRGEEPKLPEKADIGYRAVNSLTGHQDPIMVPKDATTEVQYEGELVVVIGKTCKNVTESQALDYVFGYTIGNDVSERTWQRGDRTFWRAKNSDTFAPMGPWIVTDLEPDDLHVTVRLNERTVGEYDVKSAIFSVRHYISEMSKYLTLVPGDVVWMGTDGATENMKDGDTIEVDISEIGTLSNKVVWEK